MNGINKLTKIIAKILEIGHWVAAGLMAAVAICAAAAPQWLGTFMDIKALESEDVFSVYGFHATVTNATGKINNTMLLLCAIGAVIIFSLMAMVFRNIYLMIKRSENGSPFQKDNIRMLREIGIFSIAIPVVGLIMSTIMRLVIGIDAVETSMNLDGFIMGIIVLCLTQFFAHGAQLEKDVDGLL